MTYQACPKCPHNRGFHCAICWPKKASLEYGMTYKLPTKKQTAAYKKQAKATLDRLGFRPATPIQSEAPDGHMYTRRDFEVDTECGLLYCSIDDDWLACIFDDVKAAVAHPAMAGSLVLNPHSGKWNWDDLDAFEKALSKIVAPSGYYTEPVVGGFIWKNDKINEGSWRFDTRIEAVAAAKAHAGEAARARLTKTDQALTEIQQILSDNQWDSDTVDAIAEVMRAAGYEIDGTSNFLEEQPDLIEYSVCQDCLLYIAHAGEELEDGTTEQIGRAIERELDGKSGHFSVGVAQTEDDPDGDGHEEFSHRDCELCRSKLGGSRHGVTLFITGVSQ